MILQFAPLIDVGWSRGSNSRCRMPKEVSGLCNGRVRPIPKADKGIWQARITGSTQDVWKIHRAWLR